MRNGRAFAFALILIVIVCLLVSCEPGELTVTVTPGSDVTPTQEGPHWSIDCVREEWQSQIINPNPCPVNFAQHTQEDGTVQEIPAGMGLYFRANEDGFLHRPDAVYEAGATHLYTYGMIGDFGVTETVQMIANHCYTFNVPVTINFLSATEWDNFLFYSILHRTDTGQPYPLNTHPAVLVQGDTAKLYAHYPDRIYWTFQPNVDVTVEWEVGFRSVWATSAAGNYVDFEAFVIQDQFNTNICN